MSAMTSMYNQSSLAYKYDSALPAFQADPEHQYKAEPTPRIDVIPGGRDKQQRALSPSQQLVISIAKCAVAFVAVFATIGIGRVTFSSLAVQEAMDTRAAQALLEDARSSINVMEVQQSTLSNPTRIKTEAEALGMSAADSVIVIDITGDVLATDEAGNLSLTDSLEVVANASQTGQA